MLHTNDNECQNSSFLYGFYRKLLGRKKLKKDGEKGFSHAFLQCLPVCIQSNCCVLLIEFIHLFQSILLWQRQWLLFFTLKSCMSHVPSLFLWLRTKAFWSCLCWACSWSSVTCRAACGQDTWQDCWDNDIGEEFSFSSVRYGFHVRVAEMISFLPQEYEILIF